MERKKKYDNPYIFVDNLAGFKVYFVVDPTVTKMQAKMHLHPDDYDDLKKKLQTPNQ